RMFERLVTPERTRAIASEADLQELAADPAEADRVLARLVEARLLVAEKDETTGGVSVEIVHESLIVRWPMLSRWLDENKEDADFLARLRIASRQWRESGKARGLLWREEAMLEARRFRERSRVEITRTEQEFLDAVFSLGELAAKRRRLVVLSIVAASFIVAISMATLAWKEREAHEEATEQAARTEEFARRTRVEAARARDAARAASARDHDRDPTFALSLLREVELPEDLHQFSWLAPRAARRIVAESVFPGHDGQVWTAELSPDGHYALTAALDFAYIWDVRGALPPKVLRGHTGPVWRATYSPDGSKILTASWDKTARIWPVDGGDPVVLQHAAKVSWAAWSPDGQRVVTAGWDPAAYVFRADGKGEPMVLRGHTERLRRASFSPDGRHIVTASFDDTARVWDLDGGREPIVLGGHGGNVTDAVFSPDGAYVATISSDEITRVFPAAGTDKPKLFGRATTVQRASQLNGVAWSPDGKRIATAGNDGIAAVWRVDDESIAPVALGKGIDLRSVAFSPDGQYVLTTAMDNIARLWRVGAIDSMAHFVGHELGVEQASFSRDGKHFITASGDGSARIWSTEQKNAPRVFAAGHNGFPDVDLAPDGQRMLVIMPADKVARIWDIDGINPPRELRVDGGVFIQGAWSFDGQFVLTATENVPARLWSTTDLQKSITIPLKNKRQERGAFSTDSQHVAIGNSDGSLAVVRIDGQEEPLVLTNSGNRIVQLEFALHDKLLLTLGKDEPFVRIWNVPSGAVSVLEGHTSDVLEFALSPDRERVLTVSTDNTARVSNLSGNGEAVVLRGHTHKITSGAFSPDGRRVATASADGTIRVWNADGMGEPLVLRQTQDPPRHVVWSPDGSRIAAASERVIYVWNADGSGIPLFLEGHTDRIHQLHWCPDGKCIVSSAYDGTVRVWSNVSNVPSFEQLNNELWSASTFCLSLEQRRDVLGVADDVARRGLDTCRKKNAGIFGF
ncbi:MAG TPA: WD40 repeat domain-containing protein, partial [Polyangium sp.]|nr:WD40 repeat domain-containing protein [Polyangium sp.]